LGAKTFFVIVVVVVVVVVVVAVFLFCFVCVIDYKVPTMHSEAKQRSFGS